SSRCRFCHVLSFPTRRSSDLRAPFASIEPPCLPQAIDLTEGDSNLPLRFCDRMEHHPAWTGGIVVKQLPKKGLVSFRHFSPSTKDRKSTRLNSSHQIISYAVF